jgi:FtsH-binding integral membrane protein
VYESKAYPPISRRRFMRRVLLHFAAALALLLASLAIGMAGYEYFEQLPWRDAFLNAAMLLGGMGPVDAPRTDGGKLFEGLYALYAGLVFLVSAGLILTPVVHRVMHKFHWEQER